MRCGQDPLQKAPLTVTVPQILDPRSITVSISNYSSVLVSYAQKEQFPTAKEGS